MAILLPFAGAAIGSAFFTGAIGFLGLTGASAGFLGGQLLGSLLAPTQKVQGPRLGDLRATTSSYGAPIPYLIGHPRVGAQVIWASAKREIPTTTKSGKGGPKVEQTTYTYEQDILFKLSCNPGAGVLRIFQNGDLVSTISATADFSSIVASGEFCRSVRVHTGAQTQLPDPTYEAAVGAGNAPAYRGSVTVMFEGANLGGSGQMGNFTFEFMQTSTAATSQRVVGTAPVTGSVFTYGTPLFSREGSIVLGGNWDNNYLTQGVTVYQVSPDGVATYLRTIAVDVASVAGQGASDEPVLAMTSGEMLWADGRHTKLNGASPHRFVKKGDLLFAWGYGSSVVRQFDPNIRGTPTPDAYSMGSVTLSAPGISGAIDDANLYVLEYYGAVSGVTANIRVIDIETLTIVNTIVTPVLQSANDSIFIDELNDLYLLEGNRLWLYNSVTGWSIVMTLAAGYGAVGVYAGSGGANSAALIDGVLYTDPAITPLTIRASWLGSSAGDRPLGAVVQELCERAGISPTDVDVSALSGKFVRAYAITPSTARQALEFLASTFMFEFVGLKCVLRGGAPVATIPWEDLGSVVDGEDPGEPLALKLRNDIELPAYIHVKYMNVLNDYQDGLESSDRLSTQSTAVQVVEVPLGLTPTEAKQLADILATDLQASMVTIGPVVVQRKYEAIEPTDVLLFTAEDGSTFRGRVQKRAKSGGLITWDAVFDDASVISSAAVTDSNYSSSTSIYVPPQSRAVMLDIPILRDADNNAGVYAAVDALSLPSPGATLFLSQDDTTYEQRGQVTEEAAIGIVEGVLGAWSSNTMDFTNTFIVSIGDSPLASASRDDVFNNSANAWAIGAPGRWEIGQSCNFSSLGGGRYLVSGHLRGRRGTEHNTGNHAALDTFVLLTPGGLLRPGFDVAELNSLRYLKAITAGRTLASGMTATGTNTGVGLKPLAPANLRSTRSSNDIAATWDRRSRLSQNLSLGTVPLGETTEAYELVIYTSNTYATERRVIAATTGSATYTSAMQTADGATPGAVAYARVFQISDKVGRGYALQGTI